MTTQYAVRIVCDGDRTGWHAPGCTGTVPADVRWQAWPFDATLKRDLLRERDRVGMVSAAAAWLGAQWGDEEDDVCPVCLAALGSPADGEDAADG